MYSNMFDGLFAFIAVLGVIAFGYVAYDLIFSSDEIVTEKPIKPELRLTVKDNKVDTLYVYRKP